MSADSQTMFLHAVPLLVLAGLYGLVSLLLAVSLVRERRATGLGLGIWLLFTLVAAISALLAVLALVDRDVLAGEPSWLIVAGAAAVAIPGVIVLVRGHDRALLVTARRRVREAEEIATERGRRADAISRLSSALSHAQTAEDAARSLLDEVEALLEPDVLLLARIDEELRTAVGLVARGVDEDWWRSIELDLDADSGAIVSVVRSREALSIYDAVTSTSVNRALADAVQAKSAAFVPLLSEGDVVGVLVVVTRTSRRSFTPPELEVVQGLASEAALALGRARSNEALRAALERERLIAEIGRRVRSELDLDTVLRVAVEETARAIGVSRSFVRLGEPGEPNSVLAEWNEPGVGSVGDAAPRLPALNLAARERRTVAVDDVETSEEIADPQLGDLQALRDLGVRSTLGTPIVVFDRLVGVFGLHRSETTRWLPGEIVLAEAVARELGLAIHTARLLGENEQRLRRQETLIEAAQVLTSDLRFESVIRRLVEEVVALTGADAADCWILEPDSDLLRCRAVVGVPEWNVGRQIPAEGTIGRSLRTGESILTHDFATTEQPPPSPPYAVFSDVMSTPITWLGEARGVLGVCSREAGRFDESDIEVVEAFARFASLALHNAESFEERERQTQAQRGFYRIAQVLGTTLSRAETLDALAQAACDALGGDAALVLELRGAAASVAGTHELPETVRAALTGEGEAPLQPFAGPGALERILVSTELAADDRFDSSLREPLVAEGYGSLLCAPVAGVFRDQAHAVVVLFRGARTFADEDVSLTEHLSGAARGALERSELFEGERRARTFSQRLARVGALLATSLDSRVVLDEVAREAPGLLAADAAVIRLLERDELVVRAAAGPGTEHLAGTSAGSATGISGAVAQSRAPAAVRDAEQEPRLAHGDLLLEPGTAAACVAVPLVAHGGGLYGVLAVYASAPRAWRDDEVQTLSALAAAASASVANAELYQRVAEEKERSGAILANIADGIVAVDREGRILLWNARAEQITGVPASEALGRLVPEVLQRELAADGAEASGERQVAIRRDGEEVWLALSEAVMRDAAGAVAGRIFAFRDVSRERVVELMRSEFVSTVSHELRTPLTSIYGFAETLKRPDVDFTDTERETFLRYIASESERLIRIVDDLLDVARLEAGTLDVALEPTEVGRAVREAVAAASAQANGSRLFSVQIEPAGLAVRADREKFGQVLANLLENAVRYSPEGGTISVAARGRRGAAEITVADEGVGIAEGDRERVFTKFFRSERSAAEQGAGLGLFLVRGLVTAMGGRIWVESEEGLGSRFTFELPLADGGPAASTAVEAAAS
ncbi:MAG TPA: GAF domain-containing protein [Gaiellaceae bacterium]|nr:GAF domain-containing protein [Gaiellaceae bacterium]